MENSESIATIRVRHIVSEFAQLRLVRANGRIEGRSNCSGLQVEPVAVAVRSSRVIVPKDVVRVGYPEAGGRRIRIEKRIRSACVNHTIAVNQIFGLSCIFDKYSVTHCHVRQIVDDLKVVNTVDCHRPIVCLMN